jgi:hypothetical protein
LIEPTQTPPQHISSLLRSWSVFETCEKARSHCASCMGECLSVRS